MLDLWQPKRAVLQACREGEAMSDEDAGGCFGCFVFLLLLPFPLVLLYWVWDWALKEMGLL